MITSNGGRYWTTVALLALAAGSATAAEFQAPGYPAMEIVEVVEKSLPAPVDKEQYFAPIAEDLTAALRDELRKKLAASALSGYQLLAGELELSNGTRVASNDARVTDDLATKTRSSGT